MFTFVHEQRQPRLTVAHGIINICGCDTSC